MRFFVVFLIAICTHATAIAQIGISIVGFEGMPGNEITVDVNLTNVETTAGFSSFSFKVVLDVDGVEFLGHDKIGTLSAQNGWSVNSSTTNNNVGGFSLVTNPIVASGTLIRLRFELNDLSAGAELRLENVRLALSSEALVHAPNEPDVSISEMNGPPAAIADQSEVDEDDFVLIPLSGVDPNGDPITYQIYSLPGNGDLDLTGSLATYTPAPDFFGADSFEFTVSDGMSTSDPAQISIDVLPVQDPPTAAMVTSPANGETVVVSGNPEDVIPVAWSASVDVDGDDLTYEWEVATSDAFTTTLLTISGIEDTGLTVTVSELAALLALVNVGVGESLPIAHRITVSDGNVDIVGPSSEALLTRGLITGIKDPSEFSPNELELTGVYPFPTSGEATVVFDARPDGPVELRVYDLLGRQRSTFTRTVPGGTQVRLRLQVDALSPGLYHIVLTQREKQVIAPLLIQ